MVISGRRAVSSRKFQRIAPPPRVLKQRAMTIKPVNSPLIVMRPFGPSRATVPPSCSILPDDVAIHVGMHTTQYAVDLDRSVSALRNIADQLIDASEAVETLTAL